MCCNQFTANHPVLRHVIGIEIFLLMLWLQNTSIGFWLVVGMLTLIYTAVFGLLVSFISEHDLIGDWVIFGFMFYRMSVRHTKRIRSYPQETRPVWNFFDLKSYLIMAFMMSGGIWLRNSGLAPEVFIAVFYTGLGCALGSAGILFWVNFIKGPDPQGQTE